MAPRIKTSNHTNLTIRPEQHVGQAEHLIQHPVWHSLQDGVEKRWGIGLWKQGVPNSVRTALLRYMHNGTALLVEILNDAILYSLIDPQAFTTPQLLKAAHKLGYTISERTLFRYMRQLLDDEVTYGLKVFFASTGIAMLTTQNPSTPILSNLGIENTKNTIPKTVNNGNLRPRQAAVYSLYTPEIQHEAIEKYASVRIFEAYHPSHGKDPIIALLRDTMTDQLTEEQIDIWEGVVGEMALKQSSFQQQAQKRFTKAYREWQVALFKPESSRFPSGWQIGSHQDYVIAYAHALGVENEEIPICQSEWAKSLGVTINSVKDKLHRAGLMEITPRETVESGIKLNADVDEQLRAEWSKHRGYPRSWETYTADGMHLESIPYNSHTVSETVQHFRENQVDVVKIKLELAYAYRVVSDVPVKIKKQSSKHSTQPPKTPYKSATKRTKTLRAPVHDPQWLAEQARMVMEKAGYCPEGWRFADANGEITETQDPVTIVAIYATHVMKQQTADLEPNLPEQLDESSILHQIIAEYMAKMGYQKVIPSPSHSIPATLH